MRISRFRRYCNRNFGNEDCDVVLNMFGWNGNVYEILERHRDEVCGHTDAHTLARAYLIYDFIKNHDMIMFKLL